MTLKEAIASFIKKVKCKCKCASFCEVEVSGNDVVDAIDEIERVITPPPNSPINRGTPPTPQIGSPNIIHRPLPPMPREEDEREYVAIT
tara:strand:- start:578 stop:844 length:267 start_codon:yes stop_codon:yes gene_type:complete